MKNTYIERFYCGLCKKLKHKTQLTILKPLTLGCNSCINKEMVKINLLLCGVGGYDFILYPPYNYPYKKFKQQKKKGE